MRICAITFGFMLLAFQARADNPGIPIRPDETGQFEHIENFDTARFLTDSFVRNLGPEQWQPGSISNKGPHGGRQLTYRFYGDRVITGLEIGVEQSANSRNLGGRNALLLSLNGLDWQEVDSSSSQPGDPQGWQRQALTVTTEQTPQFSNRAELWVRLQMDNHSGASTGTSNTIHRIKVNLKVGEPVKRETDPQAQERKLWGQLRTNARWQSISLDWADTLKHRAPHYYEDVDGWLQPPGRRSAMSIDRTGEFLIRRAMGHEKRLPLSLATFVKTVGAAGPLMARITVRATPDSSRDMHLLWDGKLMANFDIAHFFERDRTFYVQFPGPQKQGVHELRIAGQDAGQIRVREINVVGAGSPQWIAKPSLPPRGELEVLSAYYTADPEPPADSQTVEGRHKRQEVGLILDHLQRLYAEHGDFGAIRVVLHNRGKVPARIGNRLLLNGKSIEDHDVDFQTSEWDARGVVWYRIRPKLVEPGRCAQVFIRFRRRLAGPSAAIEIEIENGEPLSVDVPYKTRDVAIDYVTAGPQMKTLYVYARRAPNSTKDKVKAVILDGQRVEAKVYGSEFPGNVALALANLAVPLKTGEYHVAGVQLEDGTTVAAQFRVLPFFFPRSSIHVPPEQCPPMHMNLQMWRTQSLEQCRKYNIFTTSTQPFDLHERVAYVLGPDEPDAHDNRGGGHDRGLGYHARRLAYSGWQELIQRFAPHATSWIIMNGTTRPLNWSVYGQVADISCFDPYPVTYYAADHAYVRESLGLARLCGAPNRLYGCMEAFGWGKGQGVPRGARGPTPAEYRQNIVQAIGIGLKGLTSWVYSRNAGGWQMNEPCRQEIARLNKLIEHIEDELLLATPIDLASSDAGVVPTGVVNDERWPKERVWVSALLSGPDTIVLAVAQHIPARKPDLPTIEPARDVTITVELPEFLTDVVAFEATEDGLKSVSCKIEAGHAIMNVDVIDTGRVFVLRRR